jgi:hypothetical protein
MAVYPLAAMQEIERRFTRLLESRLRERLNFIQVVVGLQKSF